jgi:hypothetical protein
MAISLKDLHSVRATLPPRVLIYGPPGIGKTSLASEFPLPIFLQIEDGTPNDLELQSFGQLTSYDQVMEAITALYTEEHSGATVVLDSLDKLEPLLWAKICTDNQWLSIEAPGYGRGYVTADQAWRELLEGLNALRRDKHMGVVLIAHSTIDTVNDPTTASYSQYNIRLHKRAIGIVQDEMDAVLFLNQDVSLLQNDPKAKAGPGTRLRAAGGGNRFIHATPRPAYVAKNRFGLPDKIQYEKGHGYETMKSHFPGEAPSETETRKKPNGSKVESETPSSSRRGFREKVEKFAQEI